MPSNNTHSSWLLDNDRDVDGMQVIADLHGGDLEDVSAKAEFQEIKDRVTFDVSYNWFPARCGTLRFPFQRASGEARSYKVMWERYRRRVLLAMSSQAFAQLVSVSDLHIFRH